MNESDLLILKEMLHRHSLPNLMKQLAEIESDLARTKYADNPDALAHQYAEVARKCAKELDAVRMTRFTVGVACVAGVIPEPTTVPVELIRIAADDAVDYCVTTLVKNMEQLGKIVSAVYESGNAVDRHKPVMAGLRAAVAAFHEKTRGVIADPAAK